MSKKNKKQLALNIFATISGLALIITSPFHICPLIALASGVLCILAGFPTHCVLNVYKKEVKAFEQR